MITVAKAMSGQKAVTYFEGITVLEALSFAFGQERAEEELVDNQVQRRILGGTTSERVYGDFILADGDSLFVSEKHDNG